MIARKTALIIAQNAVGMLFGYVALKFIAVEIGNEELGMMGYGFSIVALFSFISNLGFPSAHMKRVSEGQDLGACIGTFAIIKIGLTALMAGAVIAFMSLWKFIYPEGMENVTEAIIYAVLVYFIFQSLGTIASTTFDARAETSKSQLSYLVQHPFKMVGVLFAVFGAGAAAKVNGVTDIDTALSLTIFYYTIVGVVVFLSAWTMFLLYRYPIKRPNWPLAKSYTKFALPSFMASFLTVLIMNSDRVMIGYFWDNTLVGDYFGVQKLSEMFVVLPTALGMLLFPVMSNMNVKKHRKAMKRLIQTSERYMSMILVPITFFIFFFSYELIHLLLSDQFLGANWTLSFLGIYALITALYRPRIALLQAIDRPDLTATASVLIAVLNICINLLLIPGWDWFSPTLTIPGFMTPSGVTHHIPLMKHTGAAVATTISSLAGFAYLRYLTWRHVKADPYHGFTVKHAFGAFIMIVVLIYLSRFVELDRWYILAAFIGIGLVIYMAVLYAIREFKKRDLDFYIGIVDPRAMGRYMKEELREKDLGRAFEDIESEEE